MPPGIDGLQEGAVDVPYLKANTRLPSCKACLAYLVCIVLLVKHPATGYHRSGRASTSCPAHRHALKRGQGKN